jgi:hypothetical protein
LSKIAPFVPGSIHNPAVRSFWTDTLQCAHWVLSVLTHGYRLPFRTAPGEYEEANNATVFKNPEICAQMVMELRESGVIEFVDAKPWCVSPLGLVSREVDGVVKNRLVFDASRWINLHIDPPAVKLSTLDRALQMTRPGDYQIVFDLRSAYYNVKIAEEDVKYLGAAIMIGKRKQYFVFKHLPFGLNSAVHAITKLWKPIIAFLQKQGIRASIYIDDGRVLAVSADQAEEYRTRVYDVVTKAGWQMAPEKSDGFREAAQVKQYLGFIIDAVNMRVFCPESKLQKISQSIIDISTVQSTQVRTLAKVLGNIISLIPSHGALARICTRSGYVAVEKHVELHGWKGALPLDSAILKEFEFFNNHISSCNGHPIEHEFNVVRIESFLTHAKASVPGFLKNSKPIDGVIVSDASDSKAAVKYLQGSRAGETFIFNFHSSVSSSASGARELMAVLNLVRHCFENDSSLLHRANVIWATDSQNLVTFLTKGSSKPYIQDMVFEILLKCSELFCSITPIHLYREDDRIREVDALSKSKDSDNWSIDFASFQALNDDFHFEIDLFADVNNAKTTRFFSKFYHDKAEAVDAFANPWVGMAWVCPPVSLIANVVARIRNSKCQGLLIIPDWPASDFYCDIFDNDSLLSPFLFVKKFYPYIFQNEDARNTPLFGRTKFAFFALYFNTLC